MKYMDTYRKWAICVIVVLFASFLGSRFVTPGPIVHTPSKPYNRAAAAQQARTPQTVDTSKASASPVGSTSATPSVAGSCPTPVQETVVTGSPRGRAGTPTWTVMGASQLNDLIETSPKCISLVVFNNGSNEIVVMRDGQLPAKVRISDQGGKQELLSRLAKQKVAYEVREVEVDPIAALLINWGPTLLIVGVMIWLMMSGRKAQMKQLGGMNNMGKSRAKSGDALKGKIAPTTFKDVAGNDEAVKELQRVVKGFVGADAYAKFGASLPKGVLLVGPPGTGKTLLAKAIAGETDGTFEATSGSDFVEMLVGVGASRVRDLFDGARKKYAETKKLVIIFIDEIDAVGGKRGGGTAAGSNQEREQTLNQILVEMDGVVSNEGIIVVAATNRVDMLDDALLRPGRFDCHVSVDLPDVAGREAIFKIHMGNRKLAANVTALALAKRTFGYSGAEIKGVCQRAFIIAAERYDEARTALREEMGLAADAPLPAELEAGLPQEVRMTDFDEGVDFVRYGNADPAKQSRMKDSDKKETTYHEGGHAVTAEVAPGADPVVKITIMRRSKALGYVQTMPDTDRVSITRDQALGRIVMAMAGRAAQEVYTGTCDAGATNDFQQACDMARRMVTTWGMSRLGPISVGDRPEGPFAGTGGGSAAYGSDLANAIDREWRYITRKCYKAARHIVEADKERMEALAALLREKETVLADEWAQIKKDHPSKVKWEELDLPKGDWLDLEDESATK